MLTNRWTPEQLKECLISRDQWHPFPTSADSTDWKQLPPAVQDNSTRRGEQHLGMAWPVLPATRFLDYARDGNRSRYQTLRSARRSALSDLVIAECIDQQGRFLDDLVNGIWCICEESFWGVPAHVGVQKSGPGLPDTEEPIVDLFAAETGAQLAWTLYLLGPAFDTVSPLVVPRVEREIRRRILDPLHDRRDFWWMGFKGNRVNNWNPWIVSNWLATALIIEDDTDRRAAAVYKAMQTLDHFIDHYPTDGGCDEGPGYWGRAGASLYECLEWLHSATGGRVAVFDEPLIQRIGQYIPRVQIADHYFINFADAPPRVSPSPVICYGYGKRINDRDLQALGAWTATRQKIFENGATGSDLGRVLQTLFNIDGLRDIKPIPPLPRDVFMNIIEVFVARDRPGTTDGFFVAAKGGHNQESHNHNDVGHVIVYLDGKPVLVDAGVEEYTAKTFGPDRYSIWTMQSAYHSLPTINGRQQEAGQAFAAGQIGYRSDDRQAEFSLDLSGAYPANTGIRHWIRRIHLERGTSVTITDEYALEEIRGPTVFHVLTACRPILVDPGTLHLVSRPMTNDRESGNATLHYDADRFEVKVESITITDRQLQTTWGDALTRILFTPRQTQVAGEWTVVLKRKQ